MQDFQTEFVSLKVVEHPYQEVQLAIVPNEKEQQELINLVLSKNHSYRDYEVTEFVPARIVLKKKL